jgi:hypothetical protein
MKLFSKRKVSAYTPKSNVLFQGMQTGYKHLQSGWASWMMRRTKNFSRRAWIALLILFVVSIGSYSVHLAVHAIAIQGHASFSITPIHKLKHLTETGEARIMVPDISDVEYSRVKRFRTYMDSLARSPSGKIVYDSITRHRPGLMDSVRLIENYYQQVKQK